MTEFEIGSLPDFLLFLKSKFHHDPPEISSYWPRNCGEMTKFGSGEGNMAEFGIGGI